MNDLKVGDKAVFYFREKGHWNKPPKRLVGTVVKVSSRYASLLLDEGGTVVRGSLDWIEKLKAQDDVDYRALGRLKTH